MKIDYYDLPVPFCIIRDYMSEKDMSTTLNELENMKPRLIDGKLTGSAINKYGETKRNSGLFLYGPECPDNMLLCMMDSYLSNVKKEIKMDGCYWYHNYILNNPVSSTLISYYEQGDVYDFHKDEAILSALYYVWKEPKPFEGGDIYFENFKVPITNNCLLLFPSCITHRVSKISCGNGRWVISQFIIKRLGKLFEDSIFQYLNVLSENDYNYVYNHILEGKWTFGGASVPGTANSFKFLFMDLSNDKIFSTILLKRIEKLTGRKFMLERVYANGQTYGLDGNWHIDDPREEAWTFILYINKDLRTDGQTEFQVNGDVKIVYPVQNTGVLFKSNITHRGKAPSRLYTDLRMTIAWKLIEKKT